MHIPKSKQSAISIILVINARNKGNLCRTTQIYYLTVYELYVYIRNFLIYSFYNCLIDFTLFQSTLIRKPHKNAIRLL